MEKTLVNSITERIKIAELEKIHKLKSNLSKNQTKISTDLLQLLDSNFIPAGAHREECATKMIELGQLRLENKAQIKEDKILEGIVYVYVYLKPDAKTKIVDPYV